MTPLMTAEFRRLLATRLPLGLLLTAALLGGGLTGAMALVGPENFTPPMPGLETDAGVRALLGILSFTAFVPAAIGTVAVTSEYRHRTAAVTFLFAPRRWRVLAAKLAVCALAALAYGVVLAGTAAAALSAVAAGRGVTLGLPTGTVLALLARIGVAMAAYLLLGVGVGALIRNQIVALCVVVGYLYLGEPLLMMIPGLNLAYPVLPGGATAALTGFTYLTDAVSQQLGTTPGPLLPPAAAALLLVAYTLVASVVAVVVPMRRDVS
ncbi:ABC-2 family transporter protein [Micromonospora viridifaciens]|uniref:ABC-2 family transporter protein n=1 Tax=Micromonospora viridifaciens TaxID=1881 RepID=A0A1C4XTY7_MICVI|nr:ABC transporter permease [Micromonospora viridifaciens]SCF11776.1 ABC-2 family transporter protein [Micromonospora viridifaciens]